MQARGLRKDLLKPDRVGRGGERYRDDETGSSSPSRHWPQKATTQAAIAASKARLRSKALMSCDGWTSGAVRRTGGEIGDTVYDIAEAGTAFPLKVVGYMPSLESRDTCPRCTARMFT